MNASLCPTKRSGNARRVGVAKIAPFKRCDGRDPGMASPDWLPASGAERVTAGTLDYDLGRGRLWWFWDSRGLLCLFNLEARDSEKQSFGPSN